MALSIGLGTNEQARQYETQFYHKPNYITAFDILMGITRELM